MIEKIKRSLPFSNPVLNKELLEYGSFKEVPKGTELFRQEQYIKVLPIVLNGLVKVFSRHEEKELLLYYIKPSESCVMSFSACLKNEPSKIYAVTETDSLLLLLPADKFPIWLKTYPELNELFYAQYDLRYSELLEVVHDVWINKMDKRIYDYLTKKIYVTGKDTVKISHAEIAKDLGTAREVVSRMLRKLEQTDQLIQTPEGIKISDL